MNSMLNEYVCVRHSSDGAGATLQFLRFFCLNLAELQAPATFGKWLQMSYPQNTLVHNYLDAAMSCLYSKAKFICLFVNL